MQVPKAASSCIWAFLSLSPSRTGHQIAINNKYKLAHSLLLKMQVETEGEHSKQRNINSKVLPTDRDKYTEVEVEVEVEALRL
ncbi:hypothetical protein OWV82_017207 [Melia azedarach]|uniref:Uncharacterized protein n=1 Tax=Melia azedarach TaxID=155640 RepID=A0ACC1XLB5_MELAZ|nr:hypothetical protein OWV82_017207 [Melia azedarach]